MVSMSAVYRATNVDPTRGTEAVDQQWRYKTEAIIVDCRVLPCEARDVHGFFWCNIYAICANLAVVRKRGYGVRINRQWTPWYMVPNVYHKCLCLSSFCITFADNLGPIWIEVSMCVHICWASCEFGFYTSHVSESEISRTFFALYICSMASPDPCHTPYLQQHLLCQQLVNVLKLLEAYHSFLMANSDTKTMRWSDTETTTFVHYLSEHCSEWARGGFKKGTWSLAAAHINQLHPNLEVSKTDRSVLNKFNQVCWYRDLCTLVQWCSCIILQLKAIYINIRSWADQSGTSGFNAIKGATINDPAMVQVLILGFKWVERYSGFWVCIWAYTDPNQAHRKMNHFCNTGWEHYQLFIEIFPEGSAMGGSAYYGTVGSITGASTVHLVILAMTRPLSPLTFHLMR